MTEETQAVVATLASAERIAARLAASRRRLEGMFPISAEQMDNLPEPEQEALDGYAERLQGDPP